MSGDLRKVSLIGYLRYTIVGGSLVLACALLFGPTGVRPIHGPTGLPYSQLQGHAEYAAAYVPEKAPQYAMAVFVLCMGLWMINLWARAAVS